MLPVSRVRLLQGILSRIALWQHELFAVALRDRNEVLFFAFSLGKAKSNSLTVMLLIPHLVLLIYILYKSFDIDKRFITH